MELLDPSQCMTYLILCATVRGHASGDSSFTKKSIAPTSHGYTTAGPPLFLYFLYIPVFFGVPGGSPAIALIIIGEQWRQFTNFLEGKIFYGVREIFFCTVMPIAPYQHPL